MKKSVETKVQTQKANTNAAHTEFPCGNIVCPLGGGICSTCHMNPSNR